MFNLDHAVASWRHQFKHTRTVTEADVDEMERHLRDHVEDLHSNGLDLQTAFNSALCEMGGLTDSESEFGKVKWSRIRHNRSIGEEMAAWRGMAFNYLKVAMRTLMRNPVPTSINVLGMAIALACCVLVFFFLTSWHSMDSYHKDGDRIFLAQHEVIQNQNLEVWGRIPAPVGPALERDFPQVEHALRVNYHGVSIQHENRLFREGIIFVDEDFFDVLSFPLRSGSATALADPYSVIISDKTAQKYFPDTNPIGQEISVIVDNQTRIDVTVAGVAEPFPSNTGFRFDFLMGFDRMSELNVLDAEDWATMISGLFVKVRNPDDIVTVADGMQSYLDVQHSARPDWPISRFTFDNFTNPSSDAYLVQGRVAEAAHPALSIMFIVMAVFMLSLSCFNYINISLGSASRRLKEIGLRKVAGGSRLQLALQFMTENIVLCVVALLVGIVVCRAFLVPLFNSLFILQLEFSIAGRPDFWIYMISLVLFVGIISGLYPSLYVASFRPAAIFRGKQKLADNAWFTNAFLVFQFVLAFVTVIFGVVLTMNSRYLVQQDWGYDPGNLLVVELQESSQYDVLAPALTSNPGVASVVGAQNHIGQDVNIVDYELPEGGSVSMLRFDVSPEYPEAMNLRLSRGSFFNISSAASAGSSTIVNERLVQSMAWDEPIGKTITVDSTERTVVGVVEDFSFFLLAEPLPALFVVPENTDYNYAVISGTGSRLDVTSKEIEATFATLFPESVYSGFSQENVYDDVYSQYNTVVNAFNYLSALALLIACMGLFGLVAQNIARRTKEIGVRKVVGASLSRIAFTINRRYLQLLGVAALVATVISVLALSVILSVVRGIVPVAHMPLTPLPFSVAYAIVLLTAGVAILLHVYKIAQANPAETLRAH
ncbi:MAG: FtsX-like permease family protein [Rhodothermales bacterium]|nr:FtsX-like permease family protein [Rhodothermales bacterium]